jgi:PiT family inorganic phosphate transporter
MGVGAAKRLSAVKWGKAREMLMVWGITIPACIALGGICCWIVGNFM